MNKAAILSICLLPVILLYSCDTDPYNGQRPIDYADSIWSSEQPITMHFEYNHQNELQNAYVDVGREVAIDIQYGLYDNTVIILNSSHQVLFKCYAEFDFEYTEWVVFETFLDEVNIDDVIHLVKAP